MKATLNVDTNIQFTVNQIIDLAKQLPKKERIKIASILVEEDDILTKKQLVAKIKESLEEVKLYQDGKVKLQSAREFLNEL